jgi:hypothetical protein
LWSARADRGGLGARHRARGRLGWRGCGRATGSPPRLGRQQALRDKHADLAAQRNAALAQQLPIAEVEDLCRRLAGKLDTLTFAQRQRLVRTLFTRIRVDRETVSLEGVFDTLSMTVLLDGQDPPTGGGSNYGRSSV